MGRGLERRYHFPVAATVPIVARMTRIRGISRARNHAQKHKCNSSQNDQSPNNFQSYFPFFYCRLFVPIRQEQRLSSQSNQTTSHQPTKRGSQTGITAATLPKGTTVPPGPVSGASPPSRFHRPNVAPERNLQPIPVSTAHGSPSMLQSRPPQRTLMDATIACRNAGQPFLEDVAEAHRRATVAAQAFGLICDCRFTACWHESYTSYNRLRAPARQGNGWSLCFGDVRSPFHVGRSANPGIPTRTRARDRATIIRNALRKTIVSQGERSLMTLDRVSLGDDTMIV